MISEGLIHGTGAFSTILVQILSGVNLSHGAKVYGEWSSYSGYDVVPLTPFSNPPWQWCH